jgi:ribosome-binding protein aMBF1 (putative translation factor)
MQSGQDWTPVVFRKPKVTENKQYQAPTKDVGIEEKRIKLYSKELADAVMKCRLDKKMTQADLAKKCNVLQKDINELEARRGVYNSELTNKVLRVLGVKVGIRFSLDNFP